MAGYEPPLTVQRIAADLCRGILAEHPDWPLALKLTEHIWPLEHERTPTCPVFDRDGLKPAGPCVALSPSDYAVFVSAFTGSEWAQADGDWRVPYPDGFEPFRIYPEGTVLGDGFRAQLVARVERLLLLIELSRAFLLWSPGGALAEITEYEQPVTLAHAQQRHDADADLPAGTLEPVPDKVLPAVKAAWQQAIDQGRTITRDDVASIIQTNHEESRTR